MQILVNHIGPEAFWVIIYGQWSKVLFHGEISAPTPTQAVRQALEHLEVDEVAHELRQTIRNIYEVWAGSAGIPEPKTVVEAYLLQLVEQMRDEAKRSL